MDPYAKTLLTPSNLPPAGNPLGAPDAGLLSNYAKGGYLASGLGKQVGGGLAETGVSVANQRAQEDYAKQTKIAELKDQAQKILDNAQGKNWQQVPKPDGGYDFKDATGKPVTVAEYSRATGADPAKVLAGSRNPLDLQHNQDFQKVDQVSQALAGNDQATLQKLGIQLYGDNSKAPDDKVNVEALKKINKLKKIKPADLFQAFMSFYPHVYGQSAGGLNQAPAAPGADTIRGGQSGLPISSLGSQLGG